MELDEDSSKIVPDEEAFWFAESSRKEELIKINEKNEKNEKNEELEVLDKIPSIVWLKWLVLGLGSFQLFANYYAMDNPAALHDPLHRFFSQNNINFELFFNLMYTLYSVPNMILPFVGGYLVDRYGASYMNLLFCSLLVVGQGIVALGIWVKLPGLALFGRIIFGVGAESLCVGISVLLAGFFVGSNVALAMGLSLSISRIGSVVNNVVSPGVARLVGVSFAFWLSTIVLGIAVFSALVVLIIDRNTLQLRDNEQQKEQSIVRFRDIAHFPPMFWVLCLSCIVVYSTVLPFNNVASAFIIERECGGSCCPDGTETCQAHLDAEKSSNYLMGIPFAISGASVPIIGYFVDRFGARAYLTLFSAICLFIVHLIFAVTKFPATAPLVLQGIAYSIYASALWPSVPLIVEEHHVGLAYGILTSFQNFGLACTPLFVAGLRTYYGSYLHVEYLFTTLAGVGVLAGIALNYLDHCFQQNVLNKTTINSIQIEKHNEIPETKKNHDEHEIEKVTQHAQTLVSSLAQSDDELISLLKNTD